MSFDNPWKRYDGGTPKSSESDFISKLFKNKNDGGGSSTTFIILAIIASFVLWLSTGFYVIDADEQGVVIKLGEFSRISEPGLNYKIPYPFETVEKISVTRINKEVIGVKQGAIDSVLVKSSQAGVPAGNPEMSLPQESQMLTMDENIVDLHFYVQWRIHDPKSYLFNIRDLPSESTVRAGAESVMRQIIGVTKINEALSEQRRAIEKEATTLLQIMLDSYHAGIEVINVGILYSYVAFEVRDAYRDVQSAKADREKLINQAYTYRNDILPKAKGDAAAIIEEAKAYKAKVVDEALGQAQRFEKIYEEYRKFGPVTMDRMYIDAMSLILKDINKLVVDKSVASGTLPILPLSDFVKKE